MLAEVATLHPVVQALLATLFTWGVTAVGAATVFLAARPPRVVLDATMGFAAGVMLAAGYWSLLAPGMAMAEAAGLIAWVPAAVGFLAGGGGLYLMDRLLPHLHPNALPSEVEGIATNWRRPFLLVLAITLHNIPEGLAVGVAFGAVAVGLPEATLAGAMALALGIGLQNFPEGLAVSLVCRREGLSRVRAWNFGQASALVEPLAGVLGAAAVLQFQALLPYAMAFAAGAMFFVVLEEIIPEGHHGGSSDVVTLGALLGFVVMMVLDVALG